MKKLLSAIFVALAIIGMVTFIAPKKAMAESGPNCTTWNITCPDGSHHGYALVCDTRTLAELIILYCNAQFVIVYQ